LHELGRRLPSMTTVSLMSARFSLGRYSSAYSKTPPFRSRVIETSVSLRYPKPIFLPAIAALAGRPFSQAMSYVNILSPRR